MSDYNEYNFPADFDDLSKHAPLLAELRLRGDGFVVPRGYFDELAGQIISIVSIASVENPFAVPADYFEKFPDEIISLAKLAELKTETFEIPESYFNELDNTIQTKLALDNIKQDEGFKVPANYFEKFSEKIRAQVAVDELGKGADAGVPPAYFETLADRIAARIAEEENTTPAKTAERGRIIVFAEALKRYTRPVAIAASAALLLGVSIWFFNLTTDPSKNEIAKNTPVKQQPIVIPQQQDTLPAPVQPEQIAVQPEIKKPALNLPAQQTVKQVDKQDVLDQLDLLDENVVADYIADNSQNEMQEESLNDQMLNYLLDNDADPSGIK